jgi:hypothetical protein
MRLSRQSWVVCAALAACASSEAWEKSGAGDAVVQSDMQECRSEARTTPYRLNLPTQPSPSANERVMDRSRETGTQDAQMFQRCMQKKGYSAKR